MSLNSASVCVAVVMDVYEVIVHLACVCGCEFISVCINLYAFLQYVSICFLVYMCVFIFFLNEEGLLYRLILPANPYCYSVCVGVCAYSCLCVSRGMRL